jgi:hypothetical protein
MNAPSAFKHAPHAANGSWRTLLCTMARWDEYGVCFATADEAHAWGSYIVSQHPGAISDYRVEPFDGKPGHRWDYANRKPLSLIEDIHISRTADDVPDVEDGE